MANLSTEDLTNALQALPEFLRSRDLIALGLFRGRADVTISKRKGDCPPHIRISSHKVLFPKTGVITWLMEKHEDNKTYNKEIKTDEPSNDTGK